MCLDFGHKDDKGPVSRANSTKSQRLSEVSVEAEQDDTSTVETSSTSDVVRDVRSQSTPPSRRESLAVNSVQTPARYNRRESCIPYQAARFHRAKSTTLRSDEVREPAFSRLPPTSSATSTPIVSSTTAPSSPRRFHRTRSAVLQGSDFPAPPSEYEALPSTDNNKRKNKNSEGLERQQSSTSSNRERFHRTRSAVMYADAEDVPEVTSSAQPLKAALRDRGTYGSISSSPRKTVVRLQQPGTARGADAETVQQWCQQTWSTENYTRFHRIRAAIQASEAQRARAVQSRRPLMQKASSDTSSVQSMMQTGRGLATTVKYETTTRTTTVLVGGGSAQKMTVRQSSLTSTETSEKTPGLRRTASGQSSKLVRESSSDYEVSEGSMLPLTALAIQSVSGMVTFLCRPSAFAQLESSDSQVPTSGAPETTETEDLQETVQCERLTETLVVENAKAIDVGDEAEKMSRKDSECSGGSGSVDSSCTGHVFDLRQQSDDASDTG
ncbi:mucin-5AC-like [Ornithodoros turicata]|uniref:mucin-5AC-like n=1 Tax=Ornithodoros turicata TaxID=34597 RepID=UPI003139C675